MTLVNLALGRAVSHSNFGAHGQPVSDPSVVVDGASEASTWFGQDGGAGPVWVQVDLGSVRRVSAVRVWHYYYDGRTYSSPSTQVSVDGVSWVTVAAPAPYVETAVGHLRQFETVEARYVRDFIGGSTSNSGAHWVELQVLEDDRQLPVRASLVTHLDPSALNVAPGARVTGALVGGGWSDQNGGPVMRAGGVNGRPYFEHSGAAHLWHAADLRTGDSTIFVLAKMRGPAKGRVLSGRGNNWLLGWHAGTEGDFYGEGWVRDGATAAGSALRLYSVRRRSGLTDFYQDGVALTTGSGASSQGPNGIEVGSWAGGQEPSDVDVYEVVAYDRALSDAELASVHEYLQRQGVDDVGDADGALWDDVELFGSWDRIEARGSWEALPDRTVLAAGRTLRDAILASGPRAYWPLDRDALVRDVVSGIDGTLSDPNSRAAEGLTAGSTGALRLASSGGVRNAHRAAFNVGAALTLEAVLEFDAWGGTGVPWRGFIGKHGADRDFNFYGYSADGVNMTSLHFSSARLGAHSAVLPTPVGPGERVHVAFTVDSSGGRYYLNGQQVGGVFAAPTGVADSSYDVWVGQADNTWSGWVDDVALYARALTPAEVADHARLAFGSPLATAAAFGAAKVSTGAAWTPATITTRAAFGNGRTPNQIPSEHRDFAGWQLTGGASVSPDGVLDLPTGGQAVSPLIPASGAFYWSFELYSDLEAVWPDFAGQAAVLQSISYYDANRQPVVGYMQWSGNGNTFPFPRGAWTDRRQWALMPLTNVAFVQLVFTADGTTYTRGFKARRVMLSSTKDSSGSPSNYDEPSGTLALSTGAGARPATHATAAAVRAPGLSTGWRAAPATYATAATVRSPGSVSTGSSARPGTHATSAAVSSAPAISRGAGPRPGTHGTVGAVRAPVLSAGSTTRPAELDTTAAFGAAPAVRTTALVLAGPHATYATVLAPARTSASSTATPAALATSSAFPAPKVVAQSRYGGPAHATAAAVGSPQVRTGATPTPAVLASVAAVGAPVLSAGAAPAPQRLATAAVVGAAALSTGWTAYPATIGTVAAVYKPATSSRAFPVVHATATGFGVPGLRLGAGPRPATVATTTAVASPVVSVGSRLAVGTVATAAAVPAPAPSASSTPTPAVIGTAAVVGEHDVVTTARPLPAVHATSAAVPDRVPSTGARPTPASVVTSGGVRAVALSTSWRAAAATVATSSHVPTPVARGGAGAPPASHGTSAAVAAASLSTGSTARPATIAGVAAMTTPALYGAAMPTTIATTSGVGAAAVSSGVRLAPGRIVTGGGVQAAAVSSGSVLAVPRLATAAVVGGAAAGAGAASRPDTLGTAAAVGAPQAAGVARPAEVATRSRFGEPAVSTSSRTVPEGLATAAVVRPAAASASWTVAPLTVATVGEVRAPSAGGDQKASVAEHQTRTGFGSPEVSTSGAARPAVLATAAAVGEPSFYRADEARPATIGTSAAFPQPKLAAVARPGGLGTVVGFAVPEVRTTALVVAGPHRTYAAFPEGVRLSAEVRLDALATIDTAVSIAAPGQVSTGARTLPTTIGTSAAVGVVAVSQVARPGTVTTVASVQVPRGSASADVVLVEAHATVSAVGEPVLTVVTPPTVELEASAAGPVRLAAAAVVEVVLQASRAAAVALRASAEEDDLDADAGRVPVAAYASSSVPSPAGSSR